MQRIFLEVFGYLVVVGLIPVLFFSGCSSEQKETEMIPIRIGWQIPWATQGQITQVLAHTNILERNGLKGEFKGFSYGGPLNEAVLAGEVDVIFTADQPAAILLSKGVDQLIIGRLMYNRVALYVPPESPIKSLTELRGKKIAMPFGAAAQRVALKAIQDVGLNPLTDINSIHLDIYEQTGIVQSGTKESWGEIDALVGFDPTPAIFEHEGKARMLHVGRVVSVIVMSKKFISEYPQIPTRFLQAFTEAYLYYATHQEQANKWFKEASRLNFDTSVLDIAASVEPNVKAMNISDVRIMITEEDLKIMNEAASFIYDQGIIKNRVDIRSHIDMIYANEASKALSAKTYDAFQVQVTVP